MKSKTVIPIPSNEEEKEESIAIDHVNEVMLPNVGRDIKELLKTFQRYLKKDRVHLI